jgi:sortase A
MWRKAGIALLLLGALASSFVVFELFGTGLVEQHSQERLARQFTAEERAREPASLPQGLPSKVPPSVGTGLLPDARATRLQQTPGAPEPGSPLGIITIPAIGLEKVVVQGVRTADLREGPGHYPGTALPGEPGNAAIAGHRTTFGAPFFRLGDLRRGDAIFVRTLQGRFRYDVLRSEVVPPSDTAVLATSHMSELTLTTCNPPYSAASRLVVVAALRGSPAPPSAPPSARPSAPPGQTSSRGLRSSTRLAGQAEPGLALGGALAAFLAASAVVAMAIRRRLPLPWRLLLYTLGGALWLAVLLGFYSVVSLHLPGTF